MISIQTTDTFDAWFASLKDKRAVARIQARIDRAEDGKFGDCLPVGESISEMRIHYGPGYRVYFVQRGMELVRNVSTTLRHPATEISEHRGT